MHSAINSWQELWDKEVTDLCETLPSLLVGGAPISISCYQPSQPERLVYLGRTESGPDPISMSVGENARQIFFDPLLTAPWYAQHFTMTEEMASAYMKTDKELRKRVYLAEMKRYGNSESSLFDADNYHYRVGVKYAIQPVLASPLYHEHDYWWARLPRLGICWTVGDRLGLIDDGPPSNSLGNQAHRSPTEQLLLICGNGAGNRILAHRLNILLSGYYRWVGEKSEDDVSGQKVARSLCAEDVRPTEFDRWDRSIYLISRLLIAHHMFFPQSPVALKVVKQLGADPNDNFLLPHGWLRYGGAIDVGNAEISQNFGFLVNDLMFLLNSLVRWEHPSTTGGQGMNKEMKSTVEKLTRVSLALLCGNPVMKTIRGTMYGTIEPPQGLDALGNFSLPLYEADQLTSFHGKWVKQPHYRTQVMQTCPVINEGEPPELYVIQHKAEMTFNAGKSPRMNSFRLGEEHKLEWISKYVRARFASIDPGLSRIL